MATKLDRKKSPGKSADRGLEGPAISEFIDSAGVNSRDTGVGAVPQPAEAKKGRAIGRAVEKALANPTLVIAGLAAIPLLFLAWGLMRRKKNRDEKADEGEP